MTRIVSVRASLVASLIISITITSMLVSEAEAGGLFHRRNREVVTTTRTVSTNSTGTLGTFYPTPYIIVRGNFPTGGGYAPLGFAGDTSMALYGPTSALRAIAAPVPVYSRGYDGRTFVTEGTAFSTPNMPVLSPVVYPTQRSRFYGFPDSTTPPWWKSGVNWVDQN